MFTARYGLGVKMQFKVISSNSRRTDQSEFNPGMKVLRGNDETSGNE